MSMLRTFWYLPMVSSGGKIAVWSYGFGTIEDPAHGTPTTFRWQQEWDG